MNDHQPLVGAKAVQQFNPLSVSWFYFYAKFVQPCFPLRILLFWSWRGSLYSVWPSEFFWRLWGPLILSDPFHSVCNHVWEVLIKTSASIFIWLYIMYIIIYMSFPWKIWWAATFRKEKKQCENSCLRNRNTLLL